MATSPSTAQSFNQFTICSLINSFCLRVNVIFSLCWILSISFNESFVETSEKTEANLQSLNIIHSKAVLI